MLKRFLVFIFVFAVSIFAILFFSTIIISKIYSFKINVTPYERAEVKETSLYSRKWMNYAMSIVKKENFAPAIASRFYSYIASIYADVLEKTHNQSQANLATTEILNSLAPKHSSETSELLSRIDPNTQTLHEETIAIIDNYKRQLDTDGFTLSWDKKTPPNKWYIRDGKIDGGAMAGNWKPWLLNKEDQFSVPTPPVENSIEDKLDIEKIKYEVSTRSKDELEVIYFWHGSHGFVKGQTGDNITPSGVWQNILFIEMGKNLDDAAYAKAQKILAQSIADSFIETWKVKYTYYVKRPSMRIADLDLLVQDPPFPSYVSGHSAISATAATVLSYLFPQKTALWMQNAEDAKNSRIKAGIHFDSDNVIGKYLGIQVGNNIIYSLSGKKILSSSVPSQNSLISYSKYIIYKSLNEINLLKQTIQNLLTGKKKIITSCEEKGKTTFKDITTSALPSGLVNSIRPQVLPTQSQQRGLAAADLDNDGFTDLVYLGINDVYVLKNTGKIMFEDVTATTGITKLQLSTGVLTFDYNNDGKIDILLYSPTELRLYKNEGEMKFTDVTEESFLTNFSTNLAITGVIAGDYNNDGKTDIYIINNSTTPSYNSTQGSSSAKGLPNILLQNNGNVFSDVTVKAGVGDNHLGLAGTFTDYNNDGYQDIFIANDFGTNSLYRNDKNGHFTDVSTSLPQIVNNGMGVASADFNNDGYTDVYVTGIFYDNANTDQQGNLLFMNKNGSKFEDVSKDSGTQIGGWGWGTVATDFNNDGYTDIAAVSGFINSKEKGVSSEFKNPHLFLFKNKDNMDFNPCESSLEIKNDGKGLIATDINNDAYQDLIVNESGIPPRIFLNSQGGNNWVKIKFESKEQTLGTKVWVKPNITQYKELQTSGSFVSTTDPVLNFGLGQEAVIKEIKTKWPDGKVTYLKNVSPNKIITVKN